MKYIKLQLQNSFLLAPEFIDILYIQIIIMRRFYYILLSAIAIAAATTEGLTSVPALLITLFPQSLEAQENYTNNSAANFFVCTTKTSVRTLFLHTSAKTFFTSLITWHQESSLPQKSRNNICQQAVKKIQYLEPEPRDTTSEQKVEQPLLCNVNLDHKTCNSDYSEALFESKPKYDSECILNCREPLKCLAEGKAQGTCSISEPPYEPIWWLW